MSIAVTEDHRALAQTVADFLAKHQARAIARGLLEAGRGAAARLLGRAGRPRAARPPHPRGATAAPGSRLSELLVVVEELGRAVAPGPFVPTVIAERGHRRRRAGGRCAGAAAARPGRRLADRRGRARRRRLRHATAPASRRAPASCSAARSPTCCSCRCGDDVARRRAGAGGVDRRRSGQPRSRAAGRPGCTLDGAPATVLPGAARPADRPRADRLRRRGRGHRRASAPSRPATTPRSREQFGRPIATFQAVKHHCANMLVAAELATAAVWDAGRAGAAGGDQLSYTAAIAATLALPAADCRTRSSTSRCTAASASPGSTTRTCTCAGRPPSRRSSTPSRPPATSPTWSARGVPPGARDRPAARGRADPRRRAARSSSRLRELDGEARTQALIETGYVMPHWPKPWGRDAGAIEQLVIEQEFAAAGIKRPAYGITGWVILTLIQHATPDQVARWVPPGAEPGRDLVPAVQRARRRARTRPASGPRRPGSTAAG